MAKKQNTDLIIPDKVLNEYERSLVVQHSINTLLDKYNGVEAYVVLYQMQEMCKEALENLKDKAIGSLKAKEQNIFGATVSTRRKPEYEYEAPTLQRLEDEKKAIAEKTKAIKGILHKMGSWIDPQTGEENTAKQTVEGATIAVSLPKGGG